MKKQLLSILLFLIISLGLSLMEQHKPTLASYDSIIVLGNSPNWNNKPNTFLKHRLDKAITLFKSNYSTKLILTGGAKGEMSEAQLMEDYCIQKGIDKASIIKEEQAKSTIQNLIFTDVIIKELNLKKSLVVTSRYHVKRTKKIATMLKLENLEVVSGNDNLLTRLFYLPLKVSEEIKLLNLSEASLR